MFFAPCSNHAEYDVVVTRYNFHVVIEVQTREAGAKELGVIVLLASSVPVDNTLPSDALPDSRAYFRPINSSFRI